MLKIINFVTKELLRTSNDLERHTIYEYTVTLLWITPVNTQ